ncbi:hypothetical protein B0H13DRAFT_1852028 [Mycena leptocephala]|nr:hypothetical protein B0H13DRAFT_1852028 [Mycena leptocephala]
MVSIRTWEFKKGSWGNVREVSRKDQNGPRKNWDDGNEERTGGRASSRRLLQILAGGVSVVRNEPMLVNINFGTVRLGTMECEQKEAATNAALRECFGVGTDREPGMTDGQQTCAANEVVEGDRDEEEGREGKDVPAAMFFPLTSCTSPAAYLSNPPMGVLRPSNGRSPGFRVLRPCAKSSETSGSVSRSYRETVEVRKVQEDYRAHLMRLMVCDKESELSLGGQTVSREPRDQV